MILVKSAAFPVWKEAARLAASALLAGISATFFVLGIITMQAEGSVFCLLSPAMAHCGWCLAGALTALGAVIAAAPASGTSSA
ncbi:MAG TPA: hypothetical protein PLA85_02695 [Micropepsaceae bacterium]|nr:hypothetical protein [Micropepsaceae bacterium]